FAVIIFAPSVMCYCRACPSSHEDCYTTSRDYHPHHFHSQHFSSLQQALGTGGYLAIALGSSMTDKYDVDVSAFNPLFAIHS
ncbi:MAG: hypothetical protein ACRCZS_05230, partial [Chroococcidiopsis sp.]